MHATRMIVCECGVAKGPDQLKQTLIECGAQVGHSFSLITGMAATMSPEAVKNFFARYPNAKVLPDRRRQIPPKPFGPDEWKEVAGPGATLATSPTAPEVSPLALSLMKVDEVHALGLDGSGVRVCVIDSGIDFTHPDLQGLSVAGPDGKPLAADFTETDLLDTVGHGTAVAGCIAAQGRQIYTITDEQSGKPMAFSRIMGMAPAVQLITAKVFDTRVPSGYDSSIIAALEWAAANGAHIVNMSLGGTTLPNDGSDPLAMAVSALRERGILVVVSAGNEGGGVGTVKSPGSSLGALTVGASTSYRSFSEMGFLAKPGLWTADQLASFSSLGPSADGRLKPEILAPGAFDWGLAPTNESEEGQHFQLFGGTSQAAPLMTGVAALIYQAFQKARGRYPTPDELVRIACSTADDLGFPAHMQGAGRANALRAVQAVLGQAQAVTVSLPQPMVALPGQEATVSLDVTNVGTEATSVPLKGMTFESLKGLSHSFQGEIATAHTELDIPFNVAAGVDLLHISLDWPSEEHGPRSPRLMVAVYDPKGRFANYQRPNGTGDVELGKSVDTWIARPAAGRWTARVVLRLGARDTVQPYTLSVRAYRRTPWNWVAGEAASLSLAPGETRQLSFKLRVPEGTPAGTHAGHLMVGATAVPVAVVVPIAVARGQGSFAGSFQHGYQGDWGNGDWIYHALPVPEGTRSLIASIQWPDVDNALECYLVDPAGVVVQGRSNSMDAMDDGDTDVRGGQIVLANPAPGTWRLALHSFAFSGRGQPEPYAGYVELAGELVSPRTIQMRVGPGEQAPMALYVRNPGLMPLEVAAMVQSAEPKLSWQPVEGQIKTGVSSNGQAEGEGQVTIATVQVPYGAKQFGVTLTWDQPDTAISVSLYDSVAQSDRATVTSSEGQAMLMCADPVPGEWTVMAGVMSAGVENKTVNLKGAIFQVAPQPLENVETQPVTVQPGSSAVLPLTVKMPDSETSLDGRIVVLTTRGDRLGDLTFRVQADDTGGTTKSQVAATRG
ncbi:MAG TPA: S8 family serine peptidase [Symbiobacteriaceae bacterium]|nr:S8 family serine peptidase [Symbiobacteriaceae bacterium]